MRFGVNGMSFVCVYLHALDIFCKYKIYAYSPSEKLSVKVTMRSCCVQTAPKFDSQNYCISELP